MPGPRLVIEIVTPGRTACAWLKKGEDDYLKRLSRHADVSMRPVRTGRGGDGSGAGLLRREADAILKALRPGGMVVVMDQGGRELDSVQFAALVDRWRQEGRPVNVIIGGHLGLAEEVKDRAALAVSMSRMTFTHEMARLFFLEQLYRAFTIIAGSDYHK